MYRFLVELKKEMTAMCKLCKGYDFGKVGVKFGTKENDAAYPLIYFPSRIGDIPLDEMFRYCPICGEPLTKVNYPSVFEQRCDFN